MQLTHPLLNVPRYHRQLDSLPMEMLIVSILVFVAFILCCCWNRDR